MENTKMAEVVMFEYNRYWTSYVVSDLYRLQYSRLLLVNGYNRKKQRLYVGKRNDIYFTLSKVYYYNMAHSIRYNNNIDNNIDCTGVLSI